MTKNKFFIAQYIDDNKDNIIAKYESASTREVAELYGVAESTIYLRLVKWGVRIKKYTGVKPRKIERPRRYKRKFSKEYLAHRAEITKLNEGKIKYIKFEGTTEDQRLVSSIIQHPIIG